MTLILSLALAANLAATPVLAQDKGKQANGAEHRRAVSNFVQTLLDVATRDKSGIGDQVREIAQEQDRAKDNVAASIDAIQNRSKVKTFFFGTDWKNLGALRSEMVKTDNRIAQLKRLAEQAATSDSAPALNGQIVSLEEERQKIGDFLTENESKFSLFGWLTKWFAK